MNLNLFVVSQSRSDGEGVFKSPMIVDLTDADLDESLDSIIPPYELELTWRSNG